MNRLGQAMQRRSSRIFARSVRAALALIAFAIAIPAQAALLSGETLDKAADYVALVVLVVVPILVIVLFWLVHVMPEKIAQKRHHPQKDAIHTLCLLSLVFGGLLWPLAWLWAYTKPVGYRLAYGTERHDDYYAEMAKKASAGELTAREIALLREELEIAASRGQLTRQQRALRDELPSLHERAVDAEIAASTPRLAATEPEAKGVA
jgi:CBS domain containing-hemolysin-like protein